MLHLMMLLLLALAGDGPATRIAVAPAETLAVEVHGSGPAVVMIPGLFGSAFGYRHVVAQLVATGRQAIVIEPLAIGRSSRPRAADYSLTAQADRIAAVLDSLGVRGVVLVAHSMGAGMALRLALRRPELVRAVVSLEGGPAEAAATPAFRRAMSLAPFIKLFGGQRLVRSRIRSGLLRASADSSWVTDDVIARYTEGATSNLGATLLAFIAMADSRESMVLGPRLPDLDVAVLLLVGDTEHEGKVRPAEQERLAAVPRFAMELVPGAGHYLHEERPDVVVAAIERCLTTALEPGS